MGFHMIQVSLDLIKNGIHKNKTRVLDHVDILCAYHRIECQVRFCKLCCICTHL